MPFTAPDCASKRDAVPGATGRRGIARATANRASAWNRSPAGLCEILELRAMAEEPLFLGDWRCQVPWGYFPAVILRATPCACWRTVCAALHGLSTGWFVLF